VEREDRPAPAAPVSGALTLAESFELMQRALAELRSPVPHDQLRARMVALLGREDELLEPARFSRLLRQANDAEVADVRRSGADGYEISPHRTQRLARAAAAASSPSTERAASVPALEPTLELPIPTLTSPAAPEPALGDTATRSIAGLRFRRGSRGTVRPAEVPMIGVIRLEPEPQAAPPKEKPTRPRGGAARGARKPQGDRKPRVKAATPAPAAEPTPAPKAAARPRRGRGRGGKTKEAHPE
jgi:hypothetical protein